MKPLKNETKITARFGRCPSEEKEDYSMLPQMQQAIDIILGDTVATPIATHTEDKNIVIHKELAIPLSEIERTRVGEVIQVLDGGDDAIPKTSVGPKEMNRMDETVEAAALDNRNFIRAIVRGEPYLALLDPEATISLVGPAS